MNKKEIQAGQFSLLDIVSKSTGVYVVKKIEDGQLILYSLTNGVTLAGRFTPEQITALGYRVTGKAKKRDIRR